MQIVIYFLKACFLTYILTISLLLNIEEVSFTIRDNVQLISFIKSLNKLFP